MPEAPSCETVLHQWASSRNFNKLTHHSSPPNFKLTTSRSPAFRRQRVMMVRCSVECPAEP